MTDRANGRANAGRLDMDAQRALILRHLTAGLTITPREAQDLFGCYRLGARIYDLRQAGWNIITETVEAETGNKFARYRLDLEYPRRGDADRRAEQRKARGTPGGCAGQPSPQSDPVRTGETTVAAGADQKQPNPGPSPQGVGIKRVKGRGPAQLSLLDAG